jgi:hypothetical protein
LQPEPARVARILQIADQNLERLLTASLVSNQMAECLLVPTLVDVDDGV